MAIFILILISVVITILFLSVKFFIKSIKNKNFEEHKNQIIYSMLIAILLAIFTTYMSFHIHDGKLWKLALYFFTWYKNVFIIAILWFGFSKMFASHKYLVDAFSSLAVIFSFAIHCYIAKSDFVLNHFDITITY